MKQILFSLKAVFLAFYPTRSFVEAMLKYDFKIGDAKANLMQLCFSNLASWPLLLILLAVYFDPFKNSWSLLELLSFENPAVLFLLDGRFFNMLVFFLIFYIAEWLIRKEYILIGLIFYFLHRSEFHIHLATVALLAVYLSRISYLGWFSVDLKSSTKKIWKTISVLQLSAWGLVSFTTISALDFIQTNYLFSEATEFSRFNFLCLTVLLYYVFSHLFLSLWGHFYLQKKQEPAALPVYYSTANWLRRFKLSYYLQSLLKSCIAEQLAKHQENVLTLQQLKVLSPGIAKFAVGDVLDEEIGYLKLANKLANQQLVKNMSRR